MKKLFCLVLSICGLFGAPHGYCEWRAEDYSLPNEDFITVDITPTFEYQGMNIAILDEEKATAAIMPRIPVWIMPNNYDRIYWGFYWEFEGRDLPEELKIPITITHNGKEYIVTAICYGAFANCTGLKKVTIPASIRYIGDGAFYGCTSLEEIAINGFPYIGPATFVGCSALESIDLSTCNATRMLISGLTQLKKLTIRPQVQLASAKLAICLKNSVFGFEKPSFFRGLRFSFFATFLM